MRKSLEPVMSRVIKIEADYLSKDTMNSYIRPVLNEGSTIELPPVDSIPGIVTYFSADNSVILKIAGGLTTAKFKELKEHLPSDLADLLLFAILQGFNYIEINHLETL